MLTNGRGHGHVTYFFTFWGLIVSLEWVNLGPTDLVWRLILMNWILAFAW